MHAPEDHDPFPGDDDAPEEGEELLQNHPDLADELKKLFQGLDRLAESQTPPDGTEEEESSQNRPLGDFRILREIGSGGMAKVFEAEQISLKRKVALKVLSPHLSLSEKAVQKFYREAIAGARPRHPNIVAVFAMGEHDGVHFIVQELLEDGKTLGDLMDEYRSDRNHHRGYFLKMARITAEVADALEHAHGSGVIHRDVKPSNILLTREGRPKVSDFGLSRVEGALSLSKSGVFSGTPYYMSPEQAGSTRSGIDHRTDVFSLGVTLYEALTLERAFDGVTSQEVLKKVLLHEPRDPRSCGRPVPRDLALICMKAMEKDPNHRYQTMGEFAAELRRFLSGESILAKPDSLLRRISKRVRRHRARTVTVAALVVAILAVANLMLFRSQMREEERRHVEARFKGIGEALGWPRYDEMFSPTYWYVDADPSDPGGYMLKTLVALKRGHHEEAASHVTKCIELCKVRGDDYLEKDAWYLLGIIKHRLAGQEPLTDEGLESIERGKRDHDDLHAHLVWPHEDAFRDTPRDDLWYLRPVRINDRHPVVRMHEGLRLFHLLFKGGDKISFQDAIEHFKAVIEEQPENFSALFFLGRVQFFYARFFNYHHLLEEAEENVRLAIHCEADHAYPLTYTTLGQILDIMGYQDQALEYYEKAHRLGGNDDPNIHNALCGMGMVYTRQGNHAKAKELLQAADTYQEGDCHVNIALAWLHLKLDDPDEALEYAAAAETRIFQNFRNQKKSNYSTVYIVRALALLRKGQYEDAVWWLRKSPDAITSPRDLCQASFLLFSLPEEMAGSANTYYPARTMSYIIADSPICLSAEAIKAYNRKSFRVCIDYLERAMVERKNWPKKTRQYHVLEDVRDQYLLAMAHFRLAEETGEGGDAHLEYFRKAEAGIEEEHVPYEYSEIVHRIREKAKALIE